jgi:hypothetical protein
MRTMRKAFRAVTPPFFQRREAPHPLERVDPEQFDRLEFAPGEEAQADYGEGR